MQVNLYVDVLARQAIRSPTSAAPAARPDFRDPAVHTLNVYFMRRLDSTSENYNYQRFASGTGVPQARLRRDKPPDYCTFVLTFLGYDSPVIDARLPADSIAELIGATASIGKGNVQVSGDHVNGWNIEFVGTQAGFSQPVFTGRVLTPATGEIVIRQTAAGGSGTNSVQLVKLREGPLAIASTWSEITTGTTPGWTASLDTTTVPQSMWEKGNMILEVLLDTANVRSGTNGVTLLEGTTRSGTDGAMVMEAAETSMQALAKQNADGFCYLVALEDNQTYGTRMFKQSDVGRGVVNRAPGEWLQDGTVIAEVIERVGYNVARLDIPFASSYWGTPFPDLPIVDFDLSAQPSRVYKSATAAFTASDVGHSITGTELQVGTVIEAVLDAQTVKLSLVPLLDPDTPTTTGLSWTLTAIPGYIFQSATGAFTLTDVGGRLQSSAVPLGTTIVEILSTTQVRMSQKALSVATGLSWSLSPRVGTAAAMSHLVAGTLSTQAQQRLTLTQAPIEGKILLRDGGDITLPVVEVPVPVTVVGIQQALNTAYPNYSGITVKETVKGGTYDITFGVQGKQYLLVSDDSQAAYERTVAVIGVGAQREEMAVESFPAPSLSINRFRINMMGVTGLGWIAQVGGRTFSVVPDGTFGIEFRTRFAIVQDQMPIYAIGSRIPNDPANRVYHDRTENHEFRGGLRMFDWVGYKIPPSRVEKLQQSRNVTIVLKSILNGQLVDFQLASVSVSTYIDVVYTYWVWTNGGNNGLGIPPDGPFGSVVHYTSVGGFTGRAALWSGNGFGNLQDANVGTYGKYLTQSWSRRRWRANIWEQVEMKN